MKKITLFALAVFACVSCSRKYTEQELLGLWVEPIPGMAGVQGVALEKGGKARSINMATLVYEGWECSGDRLILSGESIGNGTRGRFNDTLTIEKVTADSLILRRGDLRIGYRKSVGDCGFSAAPGKVLRGIVTFAPERRTFQPEGDTTVYWLVDKSGFLQQKYVQSDQPEWQVEAELEVKDIGKSEEGFGAAYGSTYQVLRIIKIGTEQ